MGSEKEKLRIDKYLWAIRLFKTRALAAAACDSGKVKLNEMQVKPSKTVSIGDEYHVKTEARRWRVKVTALLHNRVAYTEANKNNTDIPRPEDIAKVEYKASSVHTGTRQRKIGRPTKKERRDLGDFMEE